MKAERGRVNVTQLPRGDVRGDVLIISQSNPAHVDRVIDDSDKKKKRGRKRRRRWGTSVAFDEISHHHATTGTAAATTAALCQKRETLAYLSLYYYFSK